MAANHGLMGEEEPAGARPFVTEDIAPGALLEVFLYGDLVHWGDDRATLERWRADAQQAALMDLNMRKDTQTLAHFYLGFAGVVRRILGTDAVDRRT